MAKSDKGTNRGSRGTTMVSAPTAATSGVLEQRIVALAEQLGRIVGTVQVTTEGWLDREALKRQLASVRDGAADLLEQLASTARTTNGSRKKPAIASKRAGTGRSGGTVDAPGKKHRKAPPSDPNANIADSQASKVRAARTMVKTNRRRGRG